SAISSPYLTATSTGLGSVTGFSTDSSHHKAIPAATETTETRLHTLVRRARGDRGLVRGDAGASIVLSSGRALIRAPRQVRGCPLRRPRSPATTVAWSPASR